MRARVSKGRSAGKFKGRAARTHRLNLLNPMRGGIRL